MSGSAKWCFSSFSRPKSCMHISYPHACYMPPLTYSSFNHWTIFGEEHRSIRSLLYFPVISSLLRPNTFLSFPFSITPILCSSLNVIGQLSRHIKEQAKQTCAYRSREQNHRQNYVMILHADKFQECFLDKL
jgi:hypothetical protein